MKTASYRARKAPVGSPDSRAGEGRNGMIDTYQGDMMIEEVG